MDNSLAAGRRLALQVVLAQTAVAVIAGLAFLVVQDVHAAVAALAAGLLVVAGTVLLALRVFAPALAGPGSMLARFAVGTLLKWIVVIVGFYLILGVWKLPALPALVGLTAAVLVNLLALGLKR